MNNLYFLAKATNECIIGEKDFTPVMGIFKLIITVIQWAIPVALILWGSIDLFKAIISSKDDEIKKKQSLLFKKVLAAVIVLILPWLIFWIMGLLGSKVGEFANCYKYAKPGIPDVDSSYGK